MGKYRDNKPVLEFLLVSRDTMTTETLIKEKHLIRVAYTSIDLVHYHQGVTWWYTGGHSAGERAARVRDALPRILATYSDKP